MFLEKLEIFGFKSIPHKLSLSFGSGVTGIVGPNGCGKSNLSDAIRWVLGEQSARLLRGHSMEDVIFNGTAQRKALGMAEVYLTFSNVENRLPIPYSTVAVGRRLYRSGQSEYVLNKKGCRLRDVRDLLADTGIGSSGYSLISREMVETVLADDSGQRRHMLEEAAGITKYKSRKHEALLKLKATEGDLVRVADILSEVERETRSLGRQVGRARRYRRFLDRVRHLDLALGRERVHELAARRDRLAEHLTETRAALEGDRARLAGFELTLEERRLRQAEAERALREAAEELDRHDRAVAEWSSEVRVLGERETATRGRIEEATAALRRLGERRLVTARGLETAESELASLTAEAEERERELGEREARRHESERLWKTRRIELAEKKQMHLEVVEDHVERRSALGQLESRVEELTGRRRGHEEEIERLRKELARVEVDREATASELAKARAGCETTRVELGQLEAECAELTIAADTASQELMGLTETAAAHDSRLAVLHDLRRRYEGFARGVQTLLADGRPEGIHGTVAELLRVPAELTEAVEAALGQGVGAIVTDQRDSTASYIDHLRSCEGGRATFLPLAGLDSNGRPGDGKAGGFGPGGDGILGLASTLVESQSPRFEPIVHYLLGDVLVVRDRPSAVAVLDRPETLGYRVVTLDGEMWTRAGVIAGGAGARGSVLSREQEITTTEEALVPLKAEIAELRARESELRSAREATAATQRELRTRLEAEQEALFRLEKTHSEQTIAFEMKSKSVHDLEDAISGLTRELSELAERQVTFGSALDDARRETKSFEAECTELESEIARLEEERDERLAAEQESRIAWTGLTGRLAELRSAIERLSSEGREIETETERLEREVKENTEALTKLASDIAGLEKQVADSMITREAKERRVRERETSEGQARADVAAVEKEARDARHRYDTLVEEVHHEELEHERARGEIESIAARVREEYGVELLETNEVLAEDETPEQAAAELAELKERLRRLGPVNLLAIEQYEEVRGRLEFLTKQRDDLVAARSELLEAIERINQTASELFHVTFDQVKDNFSRVFATLFEGGEANVTLVGDELEGGIEIMARPRGKTNRSIRMMSGGERALTAISLLFSIYLVKPSPFCIMDEVDAPLDDANIDRFVKLLRGFQRDTQFIVITHNKRTMEACERLYGVTMEEAGVSKLVSVRLDHGEIREEGDEGGEPAGLDEDGDGSMAVTELDPDDRVEIDGILGGEPEPAPVTS